MLHSTLCRAQDSACTNTYPLQNKFNNYIKGYMHDKNNNRRITNLKSKQNKKRHSNQVPNRLHKKQINPRKYFVNTLNRLINIKHPANKLFKQATSYNRRSVANKNNRSCTHQSPTIEPLAVTEHTHTHTHTHTTKPHNNNNKIGVNRFYLTPSHPKDNNWRFAEFYLQQE